MNTEIGPVYYVSDQQRAELLYRINSGRCTAMEQYGYRWVEYLLNANRGKYRSESSIFGTVTLQVPYEASDAVEALMCKFGILLVKKVHIRNCRTNEIVSVELTYKSNEAGIINLPL